MKIFDPSELKKLYKPHPESSGEQNGQITIIGGSKLFHGAPLLSLKVASRLVDMVFFASPEESVGRIAEKIKSKLMSFIWIPWEDVEAYIEKSDAILIGPGLMRFTKENQKSKISKAWPNKLVKNQDENLKVKNYDVEGRRTREITERLLKKFSTKKWVIDAGSLQTMDVEWIPKGAVLTPNSKELEIIFNIKYQKSKIKMTNQNAKIIKNKAKKYNCTIVLKGPETIVASPTESVIVKGGNPGMTKGGTGDCLAGLTAALLAKNDPFLAAVSASYIAKAAADGLYEKVGVNYNADDLAQKIPETLRNYTE